MCCYWDVKLLADLLECEESFAALSLSGGKEQEIIKEFDGWDFEMFHEDPLEGIRKTFKNLAGLAAPHR